MKVLSEALLKGVYQDESSADGECPPHSPAGQHLQFALRQAPQTERAVGILAEDSGNDTDLEMGRPCTGCMENASCE
jgi:hypothetical protein